MENDSRVQVLNLTGEIIAGILSWMKWHSIGWCIIHFLFGWFYVIYYAIYYGWSK